MGSNNTTKKNSAPTLPLDCIVEILEYLRNDKKSLFSNLFVNRAWCQLIIPLLWCRPFEIQSTISNFKIINTLILCLSKDEKYSLEKMNVMIDVEISPLFDYPLYIRGLDYKNLERLIECWVSHDNNNNLIPHSIKIFLFNLIGNLIFTRSRGITILTLEHAYYRYYKSNYTSFKDILSFNNIEHSLEHLQRLEIKFIDEKISSEIISRLFSTLSNCSNNIRHLIIEISVDEPNLCPQICTSFANLIESQTNLVALEVNQEYLGFSFVDSLHSQSNSLTFLKINYLKNFHSLLPALGTCTNLETLEISEYFKIEDIDDLFNSVNSLSPIHIKNLLAYQIDIDENFENFELSMMILIKLSENSLRSLTLDHVNQGILDTISNDCPTINHLSLSIIPEEISLFSKVLSSLTHLESLIFIEDFSGDLFNNRQALLDIANNLPSSLKYLGFRTMNSNYILNDFLQRINVPIQELDIFKSLNDHEMEVIIEYARKNNCLKRFGYKKVFSKESGVSIDYFNEAKSIIPIIDEARHIKHNVI